MAIEAGRVYATIGVDASGFVTGMQNAHKSLGNFSNSVNSQSKILGNFKSAMVGVGAVTATASYGLISFAKHSFEAAARVSELNVAMKAIGKATGIGYEAISDATEKIRKNGIEMHSAQEMAILFAQGNLKMADASRVARVAQDLAVISQSNSTDTAMTLAYAIQTGNSQLLKSAGITKYASEGYATYARELKKSTNALTAQERQQAIINMVLTEGTKVAGIYENAMKEPGKVLRSFPRLVDDIHESFGAILLAGFGPMIKAAYDLTNAFDHAVREGGALYPFIEALKNAFVNITAPVEGFVKQFTNAIKLLDETKFSVEGLTGTFEGILPVIMSVASGLSLFAGANIAGGLPVIGKYAKLFAKGGPLGLGLAVFIATSPKVRGVFANILASLKPLIPVVMEFAKTITRTMELLSDVVGNLAIAFEGTLTTAIGGVAMAFFAVAKPLLVVVNKFLEFVNMIAQNQGVMEVFGAILATIGIVHLVGLIKNFGLLSKTMTFIGGNFGKFGANFQQVFAQMNGMGASTFASLKLAGVSTFNLLKLSVKALATTIMESLGPMVAIMLATYALMKVFTAWSHRNDDLNAQTKSLNKVLADQMGLLKGNEQAIADYVGAASTLDRLLVSSEQGGKNLADAMVILTGSTKGAGDAVIAMKNDSDKAIAGMVKMTGATGKAADEMADIISTYDNQKTVLEYLKAGYSDAEGRTVHFTQAQIQSALAIAEVKDAAENTDFGTLQENLIKNTMLTSANAKEVMELVDADIEEARAKGKLKDETELLSFTQKSLSKHLQEYIDKNKLKVKQEDGSIKSVHNLRQAVTDLIGKQAEGELTVEMFAQALLGEQTASVKLAQALYNASGSLGSLLDGVKAAKGDMHKLQGVAFGLKDEIIANAQAIVDMGGNSADVSIMIQSLIDQFVASAKAAKFNDEQVQGLLKTTGLLSMMDSIKVKITVDMEEAIKALETFVALAKETGSFNKQQYESIEGKIFDLKKALEDQTPALDANKDSWKAWSDASKNGGKDAATLADATKALEEKIKSQEKAIEDAKYAVIDYAKSLYGALRANVSLGSAYSVYIDNLQQVADATQSAKDEQIAYGQTFGDAVSSILSLSDALNEVLSAQEELANAQQNEFIATQKYTDAYGAYASSIAVVEDLQNQLNSTMGRRARNEISAQLVKAQEEASKSSEAFINAQGELGDALEGTNAAMQKQVTFLGSLEKQAQKASKFADLLGQLAKTSLSSSVIQQIASAGADAGITMAQELLAGGSEAIVKANVLSDSVKKSSETIADVFAKSMADNQSKYANSGLSVAGSFFDALNSQKQKAEEFGATVDRLIGMGLRGSALEELLSSGVDTGLEMAKALEAGGVEGIASLMEVQDSLQKKAEDLAIKAAPYFDMTGVLLAQSLLEGMKRQLKDLPKILKGKGSKEIQAWIDNLDNFGKPSPDLSIYEKQKASNPLTENQLADLALRRFTPFASGGIVTSATLGLVGEAGPEAIIPLSQLSSNGTSSYNITVNAGMGANGAQIGAQIVEAIKKYEKSNGTRWRS